MSEQERLTDEEVRYCELNPGYTSHDVLVKIAAELLTSRAECVPLRKEVARLGDALENMTAEFTRRTILFEACQGQVVAAKAFAAEVGKIVERKHDWHSPSGPEELRAVLGCALLKFHDASRKEAKDAG